MPHLLQQLDIAIVGGGPGGLTLARLLQQQGVTSLRVYERDKSASARDQGTTLDLHEESGLKALDRAGLMAEFLQAYRPGADKVRLTNHLGEILLDQHSQNNFQESRPEIDRGPLRDLLLKSLAPETVTWDAQVNNIQAHEQGWILEFTSGDWHYADLVIAADGANSKLRAAVTSIKPEFTGFSMLEGLVYASANKIPRLHNLVNGGKVFSLGNSQSLILSAKGDGSLSFCLGFHSPRLDTPLSPLDLTSNTAMCTWFQQEFSNWSQDWMPLFEQADKFILRPQYCIPPNQYWDAQANITLLGDAAHLMPPYAGEGVNMAMLDALELCECLCSPQHDNLQAAIAQYEHQMRKRAAATAQMTLESMTLLHSPKAADFMASLLTH